MINSNAGKTAGKQALTNGDKFSGKLLAIYTISVTIQSTL